MPLPHHRPAPGPLSNQPSSPRRTYGIRRILQPQRTGSPARPQGGHAQTRHRSGHGRPNQKDKASKAAGIRASIHTTPLASQENRGKTLLGQ